MKTGELYFGFAAGDQIVFNFSEKNKKDLQEVEILEYPYNSKFAALETRKVENKKLYVATTGVYRFHFYNGAKTGRECNIKIQRVPAPEMEGFNTNVVWHNQNDTSYYSVQEPLVKRQYVSHQIIPLTALYADSTASSTDLKSPIVFPVQLPHNTVEWYYRVSVSRDKEHKNAVDLASKLNHLIAQTGGLNFGPGHLALQPGEGYCDVYIMNKESANHFETGGEYKYSIGSSRHIQSAITKVYGGSSGPVYFGINNPNLGQDVTILLECVAIVLNEESAVKNVEKMVVASRMVPVLNMDSNISLAY